MLNFTVPKFDVDWVCVCVGGVIAESMDDKPLPCCVCGGGVIAESMDE